MIGPGILARLEQWVGRWTRRLPRPLDPVRSIKAKLSILIVAAIAASVGASYLAFVLDVKPRYGVLIAVVTALAMVQVLARGLTSPLREMARAANALASSDYSRRVVPASSDEVGDLARAFNSMADDLAELERQRKELLANVSHELRTPLAALQGNLENLVDGVREPDPALLGAMLRQTERLGRLVEQLLDLSRLEAGQSPMEWATVDVAELLGLAADEARLHARRVPIRVEAAEGLVIDGDSGRLHQVIANLIDNAVRYSPDGEPVVLAGYAEGDRVVIEVSDRGPGLAPGEATRVFERFHRADDDRSRRTGGAGLGLAIARWIVEMHGGRIEAKTNTPSGCRMVVSLPRRRRIE